MFEIAASSELPYCALDGEILMPGKNLGAKLWQREDSHTDHLRWGADRAQNLETYAGVEYDAEGQITFLH